MAEISESGRGKVSFVRLYSWQSSLNLSFAAVVRHWTILISDKVGSRVTVVQPLHGCNFSILLDDFPQSYRDQKRESLGNMMLIRCSIDFEQTSSRCEKVLITRRADVKQTLTHPESKLRINPIIPFCMHTNGISLFLSASKSGIRIYIPDPRESRACNAGPHFPFWCRFCP